MSPMTINYIRLQQFPKVFVSMTGLSVKEFDDLADEILPVQAKAEQKRLKRPNRQRALGGGRPFSLQPIDQLLLTIIWLRLYPTHEVLGFLFEVSDSTARRAILSWLPLLERTGRDTMRMPDPGKHQRRSLDELLQALPQLMVVIDTFEQRVQRPDDHADADSYYSGKKKQHTLKSQVAINEATGEIVDVSASVP